MGPTETPQNTDKNKGLYNLANSKQFKGHPILFFMYIRIFACIGKFR